MKELKAIQQVVLETLRQAGLSALEVFPSGRARAYEEVVSVGVGAAEGRTMGFCNYLGESYDEQKGTVRERYGKQLDAEIRTDVWGSTADRCEHACLQAAEVLLGGLPEGIRPGELRWEELRWERETGMFLRRGRLCCKAIFEAQTQEEKPVFLDFRLKGVLKT